jgi:hypothetical protein
VCCEGLSALYYYVFRRLKPLFPAGKASSITTYTNLIEQLLHNSKLKRFRAKVFKRTIN